jgi:hypothetical protein
MSRAFSEKNNKKGKYFLTNQKDYVRLFSEVDVKFKLRRKREWENYMSY